MGLNAYLDVISRAEYRKYPQDNPAPLDRFDLYKDWAPLDQAFQGMPNPLDLALRGNRPTVEAFEDDWDAYDAFVTPAMVRKISKALEGVADNVLLDALKALKFSLRKADRECHLAAFECLRSAYREAAKQDAYLRIFIC